ncbi:hypothetical protein K4F52_008059 [Lecanicillium sp. MT-2017a]|nr:hypothetical protein K4F52_008059 [Lecanicillium sp. MT-2017a]
MVRSALFAAGIAALLSGAAQANYVLDTLYDTTNFFDGFDFFTEPDPTNGFVEYVDLQTAAANGLSGIARGGVFMGVDDKTYNPPNGRRSVRLTSRKTFNKGLFINDIAHMPGSICGVWPAYWMFGPNWPMSGEIDILEGVNSQTKNSVTLHTGPNCAMSNIGAMKSTYLVGTQCGHKNGCGQATADNQNYGDGFNAIGGGVYAMEWTDARIAVWFFPRYRIPQDITNGTPNPEYWGEPVASFSSGLTCNMQESFKDHSIVFDTTFCGSWAGSVWGNDPECSAHGPSCKDYVAANPREFAEAYWVINSLKVYQPQY